MYIYKNTKRDVTASVSARKKYLKKKKNLKQLN